VQAVRLRRLDAHRAANLRAWSAVRRACSDFGRGREQHGGDERRRPRADGFGDWKRSLRGGWHACC